MRNIIPVANPKIDKKEAYQVYKTVLSKWITMGSNVKKFEEKIKKYIGTNFAIAMNNGTSTLDALLSALNIKKDDEIIVPSFTYISTANVVLYKKAKLVLCDVDKNTFNLTLEEIKKKITKKTKLIITVDIKGLPIDYDEIKKIKKKYNIPIICDSAEAFGSEYKNSKVGSQFLAHSFSFFANKNITTGEGGAITTNNKKLYNKLKIIRNQGQEGRYNHTHLGNNYRMTDINASIGLAQINKINKIIKDKNLIAKRYNKYFSKIKEIELPVLPKYVSQHSWYNYCIKVDPKLRDKLIRYLTKNKIETRISFPPIHIQPYYKKNLIFKKKDFLISNKIYSQIIDLPIWSGLSLKQQNYIIRKVSSFFTKK